MAVVEQVPKQSIVADGTTVVFPFDFLVPTADDMLVTVNAVEYPVGVYSITGLGQIVGGNVVFSTPPTDGTLVEMRRRTKLTRSTVFDDYGDFRAAVLNGDLDRPMLALQEFQSLIDDLVVNGDGGQAAALSAALATNGASLVTFRSLALGATARSLADFFEDTVSVTTFLTTAQRADVRSNAGTLDTSAAWQATLNYAAIKGKKVRAPAGSYLLNSAVYVNSADVMIEGDGQEVTKLLVNNGTGGIFFAQGNRATCAYVSRLSSLTFVAVGTGDVLRGKAWSIVYPAGATAPATPNVVVADVNVRSSSYDASAGHPRFANCGYIANGHNVQVDRFSVNQNGNDESEGIFLDYDAGSPGFRVALRGLNLQGNRYGVRGTGAIENLIIDDFEIAVPRYGIHLDCSAVAGRQTPLLTIGKGHVNATNRSIFAKNWVSVKITQPNVALYTAATTTDPDIYGVLLENCTFIEFLGSDINSLGAGATSTRLLGLRNCSQGTVQGLIGQLVYNVTGSLYGITVDTLSNRIKFDNCGMDCLGGQGNSAFRIENGSGGLNDQISVTGCTGNGFLNGALLVGAAGTKIQNNDFSGCGISVQISGTRYASTVIAGNVPMNPRVNMSGATPSVGSLPDGRVRIVNASATTITNFTAGRDGQEIDLLFADGNTTVAHNTTIFLQGSVSAAFATSTFLSLKFDAAAGVWYETGRRT